jgi:hypothetical protein
VADGSWNPDESTVRRTPTPTEPGPPSFRYVNCVDYSTSEGVHPHFRFGT